MRRLVLAAALLAPSWSPDTAAATPPTQIDDLTRTDIRRAPRTATTSPFLYAVLPAEQDVALVHYAGDVRLDADPDDLDRTRAQLTPCTGNAAIAAECAVARNLQTRWFRGDAAGVRIWYSRDLAGQPQCYSLDGVRCVMTPGAAPRQVHHITDTTTLRLLGFTTGLAALFAANEVVSMNTRDVFWTTQIDLPTGVAEGSTFHLHVDSSFPAAVNGMPVRPGSNGAWIYSAGAWRDAGFDPNEQARRLAAVPARCGATDTAYAWCATLRALERTFNVANVTDLIERKRAHTETLFRQYEDWSVAKVETDNGYAARLSRLANAIDAKSRDAHQACSLLSILILPAAIACEVLKSQLADLKKEHEALQSERDARLAASRTLVAQRRAQQRHRLHETWAASDATHFAALLKEESKELDELLQLKADYEKTADAQHQAYLDAVAQYQADASPLGIAEHLPLIGPEIRHIADYVKDPSAKNLRRMLLGIAGPVGEAVEGVVELSTGDSGLSPGENRFLTDMLSALSGNDDFTSTMEDVVGDAIRDLGDEAIEGLRQVGLFADRAGDANEPQALDYESIVDLRARARPVTFDPWTAGGAAAQAFRDKFTPRTPGVAAYMTAPDSYDRASPASIEAASAGTAFEHSLDALFAHAMGRDYHRVAAFNPAYAGWTREQVNTELYKVVADPAYAAARRAYWVTSATIGRRHAALLYDGDHAVIVLNADFVDPTEDWTKYYIEELGHLVNWWRCDLFDVEPARCTVTGDVGARFRDAVLVDPLLHEGSYEALLAELPVHPEVDRIPARFPSGKLAWIDGWPDVYTISDRLLSKVSFSFLMRAGLDIDSEYPGVSDEFDIEFVLGAPKPARRGDPWKKSDKGYCKTDTQTDCNMPTMWLAISFRDALKLSVAGMPQVKSSAFAQSGVDLSPRIVRKHGGKLPFQLESVNATRWKYAGDHSIYYKKFTLAAETKIDLWKTGHALKGAKPSSVHKPEFGAKAVPAEGSYVVEIATRDTADFAGWLAGDIASAVLGCAGGFVFALVAEQDPVTLCHVFSDLVEVMETGLQVLDKKPTMLLEADGSVSLPSIEYKYATSGNKLRGAGAPGTNRCTGRATYHADGGTGVATLEEAPSPAASAASNPQVDRLKTRMRSGMSRLGGRGIKPIAVFRLRANFDYAQEVVQAGAYDLPSAVVTE